MEVCSFVIFFKKLNGSTLSTVLICRNCCSCFFPFSIHHPSRIFFVHSQRINLQILQWMTLCPICQGKPTIPFLAIPCQHRYCYYCLQAQCSTAPSFCCPRCGESIAALQRHGGSVHNISQIQ